VIAYNLQIRLGNSEGLLVLNAGCAPENCLGTLIRFAPDLLMLIDAANLDAAPGTIRLLDPICAEGSSASTHSLSLSMLTRYLREALACEILLLGIQPESMFFGQALTARLDQCVDDIVTVFCDAFLATA
jgi:hydrogenase 3 maturation protease